MLQPDSSDPGQTRMTRSRKIAHQDATETRMRLLYGVNQADQCWDFAFGPQRERIWARLREIDTRMIRLFVFDKGAPDHLTEWAKFAAYVEAVLKVGATPMITFGRFRRPFDDSRAIRWFAEQCGDIVWSCIEQWGGEMVRDWYWCVLNEPNNEWISGGLGFEQYRRIYEAVAERSIRWLEPYLHNGKPLIGGPAVEGFPPFWFDWPWRFVNEIDNALIGFVDWHRYADWRDTGENGAPNDEATYRRLMMAQAPDYEARSSAIARLLAGRDILNICGELNTHSHYTIPVRTRFNQSVFGATFYTAALLHLMRSGTYAEMFWVGTEAEGGYGMIDKHGNPWPVFHAKKLCARYIRYGDWISFPTWEEGSPTLGVVVARGDGGRRSVLMVHIRDDVATYPVFDLDDRLSDCRLMLKIDEGTGNQVVENSCGGTVTFHGYGVAVVTNAMAPTDVDGGVA
ncbi:MAG: hypothetical protein HYY30_04975 [Chloroflexi bacterium]|nr:hypothetical protein [Chloroflexota bacterium]